jgi:hypothetical protein
MLILKIADIRRGSMRSTRTGDKCTTITDAYFASDNIYQYTLADMLNVQITSQTYLDGSTYHVEAKLAIMEIEVPTP